MTADPLHDALVFRLRSCPDCVRLMEAADVYVDAPVGITLDCEPRA